MQLFLGRNEICLGQLHPEINIAAEQGFAIAQESSKELGKYMTPAQIAEARKLAREWLAKH